MYFTLAKSAGLCLAVSKRDSWFQDLQGVPASSPSRKLILMAEVPSTFLLRLLPHAFIGASVLLNAVSFSNKVRTVLRHIFPSH